MNKIIVIILLTLFSVTSLAAGPKQKIKYQYKKYEKFDLGNLEIKGNIIAPGDLSVKERDRKSFHRRLLRRTDFDKEIKEDIDNLR